MSLMYFVDELMPMMIATVVHIVIAMMVNKYHSVVFFDRNGMKLDMQMDNLVGLIDETWAMDMRAFVRETRMITTTARRRKRMTMKVVVVVVDT